MDCLRVMDERGLLRPDAEDPAVPEHELLRMYTTMLRLVTMDAIFYDSQRQGRISFYMTNSGEEATHIGSAMCLRDDDVVFAQYREAGVLMWRGFSLQNFADHCFSNADDTGKGRQMPVHYGSARLHFQTISSPLCTQLPQAAGAGYACKLEGRGRAVVCYFGEGAASEGDFHAGLNMAATQQTPTIFFCRNNGYAISTPVWEQYRGDGIAARGVAYGMHTIRCDGNDVFAVRAATRAARAIATGADGSGRCKPVLIEAMTYRESHHSTSDDSTRYRSQEEISMWRSNANPIKRLRLYMERNRWWNEEKELALQGSERRAVLLAMTNAERKAPAPLANMFSDVYAGNLLPHLEKQYEEVKRTERENE
jgi:2-oxoisovalerate dehydrogenase E1 component alpha subunit